MNISTTNHKALNSLEKIHFNKIYLKNML